MLRSSNAVLVSLSLALALAGGAVLAGCGPEVPANPTWADDVHPIMQARCVRCHTTIRIDSNGPAQRSDLITKSGAPGTSFDYENYADIPPGTVLVVTGSLAGKDSLIRLPNDNVNRMPPTPATRLDDWQIETLDRWSANPNRR